MNGHIKIIDFEHLIKMLPHAAKDTKEGSHKDFIKSFSTFSIKL